MLTLAIDSIGGETCREGRADATVVENASKTRKKRAAKPDPLSPTDGSAGARGRAGQDYHIPIMAAEVLEMLDCKPDREVHDGTMGGGGHTREFLKTGAKVLAMDQDPAAVERAHATLLPDFPEHLHVWQGNFMELEAKLEAARQEGYRGPGSEGFDIMFYDLGTSSRQLEDGERGFSFQKAGPLDMRMNPLVGETAADLVNTRSEGELRRILWELGEEREAGRIVRAILRRRENKPFTTTLELADCVAAVVPKKGRTHPATRTFQSLRLEVNRELECLERVLEQIPRLLKPGGRVGFLTFHSLEDRRVKHWMRRLATPELDQPEWPAPRPNPEHCLRLVTRKAVEPTEEEQQRNPRSRSCRLRVAERLPNTNLAK